MHRCSPLRTSLSKRRGALAKHLPAALTGDSHAVHQARVASRRLRETLPIVAADLDGTKAGKRAKKIRRRMRRLTRALGPVRELEVALAMLSPEPADTADKADTADTASEKDPAAPGREHVAAMLRRDLEEARERLTSELEGKDVEDWLARLEAIEAALAETTGDETKWRGELANRLDTRAAALKDALDEAGILFVSERLHEVRIALKRLRYAMELAGELRVAATSTVVRDMKAVQDILGALHDHDVLMEWTASAAEQGGLTRQMRVSLIALRESLDAERHRLHAKYLASRSTLERAYLRSLDVAVRARATARAPLPSPSPTERGLHLEREADEKG